MIRITPQDNAKNAKRYYATADYYSEGQELIGSWGGKAATKLGLQGVVDKFSFERLCDNTNPRTGEPLTVRTRSERTVGYDFTFSVPKSVSLLYAMSGDQDILEAFRGAVDETMLEIETEMKTRVRMHRQDTDRTTGNMVWAEFIHTTSRPVAGLPDRRQGVTVDKVFIGVSSESFPATYQRTAYVAVTRGKEQAQIFTDDRKELLKAVSRPDDPLSATELAESTKHQPTSQDRRKKSLARARRQAAVAAQNHLAQPGSATDATP